MPTTSRTTSAPVAHGAQAALQPVLRWGPTRLAGARIRALGIISTLALVLVLLLASAVDASGSDEPRLTIDYRVRSGDTLWEIAAEHGPDGGDVREVIEAIRRSNDVDGSVIHPGQVLQIPVASRD